MSLVTDTKQDSSVGATTNVISCSQSPSEQSESTTSASPRPSFSRGSRLMMKRGVTTKLEGLTLSDAPTSRSNAVGMGRQGWASKVPPPLEVCGSASSSSGNGAISGSGGVGPYRSNAIKSPNRNATGSSNDRMSTGPGDINEAQRLLDCQNLDDGQRERIEEFLHSKESIIELKPEDFEKLCELGSGNCGAVSKVRHLPSNTDMAKKTIHLDIRHSVGSQILLELETLHSCASPYIIGFYGAYFADGNINICMEYVDGGSLDMVLRHAGRIPEPIVSRILYAALRGLDYMRKTLNMIHRDVKPSNILMNRNGEIKLCDFGASGRLIDSVAHSFVGSRSYMAPERISGQPHDTRSDVWSLGLTLIELATGHYPIPAIEDEELYFTAFSRVRAENLKEHIMAAREGRKLPPVVTTNATLLSIFDLLVLIVEQPLPRLPTVCFTDDFIDLCASCLRSNSTDRPSLECLLKHPFVLTMAGTCPAGANRRSSVRFSDYDAFIANIQHGGGAATSHPDPSLSDIAFYLSKILDPKAEDAATSTA